MSDCCTETISNRIRREIVKISVNQGSKPVKMYYSKSYPFCGIFSDRASALKFKKELNSLIDPHKEKVMELLSCVNASADDIEDFEDRINKISLNHLFSVDEKTTNWFTYNEL